MTDFSVRTEVGDGAGDYRWLRSKHGRDNAVPATIDVSKLTSGTHYDAQTGIVPAGLPLGKVAGSNVYAPFNAGASDGTQYLAGFVLEPVQLSGTGFAGVQTTQLPVALLVHGIIDPAFVPTKPTLNAQTASTGLFVFVGVDYQAAKGQ